MAEIMATDSIPVNATMVPTFPEFKPITLDEKAPLEDYLRRHPPLISELTFTNLYAWREIYRYQLTRYQEGFLILKDGAHGPAFLPPLVPTDVTGAVHACFDYLATRTADPRIERVGEDFLAQGAWQGLRVEEDRDNFDYVYRVQELIDLKGRDFHAKKNLLNQFLEQHPDYQYLPLTTDHIAQCLDYIHAWCEERRCEQVEGMGQEHCAVQVMLRNFAALSTVGGAIALEGKIVAVTLGEPLNPDTFVIHIEKADTNIPGLYQAINREFLLHAAADFPYVNREQDLGVPGLRKAKLSYNPVRLVKKYTIKPGR